MHRPYSGLYTILFRLRKSEIGDRELHEDGDDGDPMDSAGIPWGWKQML